MSEWGDIKITDGTDQQARTAAALQPGYFNVDERAFEDLLSMAAEFSEQLNFYSLDNQVNGSWAELFTANEAVIMAMILSMDLKRQESEFARLYPGSIEPLAMLVLSLAKSVNFWLKRVDSSGHQSAVALRQRLGDIVKTKLATELHNVADIIASTKVDEYELELLGFSSFDRVWGIKQESGRYHFSRADISTGETVEQQKQKLRAAFYGFINAVSYLKTITPIYLQQSLGSQQHDPAVGLYMVFLKLYEKAQQSINSYTQRHLDFYYQRILKARPRQQRPESIHLLLRPQARVGQAVVGKDTAFSAGKDSSLNEIVYRAANELVVRDATVASVRTLFLQHDDLVAPESELAYVTRMKVYAPAIEDAGLEQTQSDPWSLFGEDKKSASGQRSADAELGFAIASPLLHLTEGVRNIDVNISLIDAVAVDANIMTSVLLKSDKETDFIRLFGRLFSRYLLSFSGWLGKANKEAIINKAGALLSPVSAAEVTDLLRQDWQGLFFKLFKKVFTVSLTTPSGWYEVRDYVMSPYSNQVKENSTGISLSMSLGNEVEAITPYSSSLHGGNMATELPVLKCCINPQANFYPYSIFNDLIISNVDINVAVKGLKNILIHNNHGQLDPSKPFHPFGPLPSNNSYFIFGNYELAKKKLAELNLNIEWGELPETLGGFGEHYRGYDAAYSNDSFRGSFSALVDGNWLPEKNDQSTNAALFASEAESGRLAQLKRLDVNTISDAKPLDRPVSEEEYDYGLTARNGFFKLALAEPVNGFAHADYPALLTRVLSVNARRKKQLPVPKPPYTPVINRMSLEYKASGRITIANSQEAGSSLQTEKVFHLQPFGLETVYPQRHDKPCYLLPQFAYQGNLYIGLSAENLAGRLTLFFNLADDQADKQSREVKAEANEFNWFYLASDSWKSLPAARVLSDTTKGFLSPGIVSLDIPDDINPATNVMPAGLFWLRVSTNLAKRSFCSCYAIQSNALKVTREKAATDNLMENITPETRWQPLVSIPGVAGIKHVGASFGSKLAESDANVRRRISERLRHKNRASVPWDYEHLVLEEFASVAKVKCFPNMRSSQAGPAPGNVLVVVVPQTDSSPSAKCKRAKVGAIELERIRSFLQGLASSFVCFEVRNPVYEQVQVRCTVKFVAGLSDGVYINRLNKAISDYICPWQEQGYKARFGWNIRQKEIESYIRELEYVDFITNFSMLHISVDGEESHTLFDSAVAQGSNDALIRPHYPWSLVIPARSHYIETIQSAHSIKPELTGVNELEIGSTFIISGSGEHGEEE